MRSRWCASTPNGRSVRSNRVEGKREAGRLVAPKLGPDLRPVPNSELREDLLGVPPGSVQAHAALLGDLLARVSPRETTCNLNFPLGEPELLLQHGVGKRGAWKTALQRDCNADFGAEQLTSEKAPAHFVGGRVGGDLPLHLSTGECHYASMPVPRQRAQLIDYLGNCRLGLPLDLRAGHRGRERRVLVDHAPVEVADPNAFDERVEMARDT